MRSSSFQGPVDFLFSAWEALSENGVPRLQEKFQEELLERLTLGFSSLSPENKALFAGLVNGVDPLLYSSSQKAWCENVGLGQLGLKTSYVVTLDTEKESTKENAGELKGEKS